MEDLISYMIAQVLGGILGGLLGGITTSTFGAVSMGEDASYVGAALAELVFTFILCFTVLMVATNPKVENNHYYGLAIGLVVASGAISVGPVSGGAFNPAVALGLSISSFFSNFVYAIMVTVINLLGGAIAGICFGIVVPENEEVAGTPGEKTPLNV